MGRGREPDPWAASCPSEFRARLRELMRWAGYKSLQQLETGAVRRNTRMPVSTANRALNNERLPTADFVERMAIACGADVRHWLAARDALADRPYLVQGTERAPDRPDVPEVCPYPGLAAFEPEQAQWFFGREEATAEVLDLLADAPGPLLVCGPSGTGKSSLLRAGLLPALAEGRIAGSRDWEQIVLTPTEDPVGRLTRCLPPRIGAGAVLVVDQFEEVFTICQDEHQRHKFVEALCTLPKPVRVVLGMRADFLGHCAEHQGLTDALRHGQVLLGPMNDAQLRAAVEKPAAAVGLGLQSGLVDVMLGDLGSGDRHGALPLLAHALLTTWRQRDGHMLTIDGYRLTGGITGAIGKTAERAYRQLTPEQQDLARILLLRMIQLGDGTADTRRQLDRASLVDESSGAAAVLDALTDARLVTAHSSTVEIAHEAVLRAWPRLRNWIDADRDWLLAQQRLVTTAESWDRDGRHDSDLYRGHRLAAVQERMDAAPLPASAVEFVRASVDQERAERRGAALRTKRLRRLVVVLSCLVLVAATMTAVAVVSLRGIASQRDAGVSRQVAGAAVALRVSDPDLSGQLAVAAYELAQTAEARGAVITALVNLEPTRHTDASSFGSTQTAVFSSDGQSLITANRDGFARVWAVGNPPSLAVAPRLTPEHPNQVRSAQFDPAGRMLATSGLDGLVRLWTTDLRQVHQFPGPKDTVGVLAFHPRGGWLATGDTRAQNMRLWDLRDYTRPPIQFGDHRRQIHAIAFSESGELLASVSGDGVMKLWNVTDLTRPVLLWSDNLNTGGVFAVAFGKGDKLMATGYQDTTARLWDISNPRKPAIMPALGGHLGAVTSVAFDRTGERLATATLDTSARIWDIADPRHPVTWAVPLAGDADNLYAASYHPDGHTLVTGSYGSTVRLWETDVDRAAERICQLAHPVITRDQWTQYLPEHSYNPPCTGSPATVANDPPSSALEALHSGKCVAPRTNTSDAPVYQFRCKGLPARQWIFDRSAEGGRHGGTVHRLRNLAIGMCLSVDTNKNQVMQRPCGDTPDQLWELVTHRHRDDGTIEGHLASRPSGDCLDITHGGVMDATHAILWKCGPSTNQTFLIAGSAVR